MDEFLRELQRQNELAEARNNYAKTMVLLRALKAGSVTLDNVMLTSDGWSVRAVEVPLPTLVTEPADEAE